MKTTVAIILLCAASAHAQPAKTADEYFEESKKLYTIEKYDEAVAALKKAYELSPDPAYLFNIAQALRKKGDCTGAIGYYRKYLRDSPDAPNRAKVEGWITELEPCAKTQKPVDTKPVDTKPVDPKPVDPKPVDPKPVDTKPVGFKPIDPKPVAPPARRGGKTLRLAGLATAATGGVFLIAGGVLALNARSIQNEIESDCAMGCDWADKQDRDDLGRGRTTLSRLSFVVGGIAVVGGGVMFALGRSKSREAPVAIVPTSDGAMVTFARRY